jgi:hypothetical protein
LGYWHVPIEGIDCALAGLIGSRAVAPGRGRRAGEGLGGCCRRWNREPADWTTDLPSWVCSLSLLCLRGMPVRGRRSGEAGNECSAEVCHPDPERGFGDTLPETSRGCASVAREKEQEYKNVVKPGVKYQLLAARAVIAVTARPTARRTQRMTIWPRCKQFPPALRQPLTRPARSTAAAACPLTGASPAAPRPEPSRHAPGR